MSKKTNKQQTIKEDEEFILETSSVSSPLFSPLRSVSNVSSQLSDVSSKRAVDLNIWPTPHPTKKTKWAVARAVPEPTPIHECDAVANPDFEGQQLVWQKFICEEHLEDDTVKPTVMAAHARSQTSKVLNVTEGISNCFNVYNPLENKSSKGILTLNFLI
jgi:hypothetical protein